MMRRDMNLIRAILLKLEASNTGFEAVTVECDGFDQEAIGYHCLLLVESGLAHGVEDSHLGSRVPSAIVTRLTWEGHEFLDNARDENVWSEAIGQIASTVGAVSLPVLTQVLIQIVKEKLGLAG